jgi:hypothetical protein
MSCHQKITTQQSVNTKQQNPGDPTRKLALTGQVLEHKFVLSSSLKNFAATVTISQGKLYILAGHHRQQVTTTCLRACHYFAQSSGKRYVSAPLTANNKSHWLLTRLFFFVWSELIASACWQLHPNDIVAVHKPCPRLSSRDDYRNILDIEGTKMYKPLFSAMLPVRPPTDWKYIK